MDRKNIMDIVQKRSNNGKNTSTETSEELVNYLMMRHKHLQDLDVVKKFDIFDTIGIEQPRLLLPVESDKFRLYMKLEVERELFLKFKSDE